ncbi:MAG TPA: prolyl oligopeptidase family serine peptidase [Rhodanobacteraceae bacterium]|nr:prolyl oligopeptidase family serine peptidase [Rhodanobacteraceae bacterium]
MSCRLRPACFVLCLALVPIAHAATGGFTMPQVLDYPYASGLAAAEHGERIAWVVNLRGVRNVWVAEGPAFAPRQATHFSEDDGQEITQLTFSPTGDRLVFVRGGDHDANWPDPGGLEPDPDSNPDQPKVTLWAVALPDGQAHEVTEGDEPALSADGRLAYVKNHQVWTAALSDAAKDDDNAGADHRSKNEDSDKNKPERLFFDRGKDGSLAWSPDGKRLAFVSDRGTHSFIGIFSDDQQPLLYLAPSTGQDGSPRWSPDGKRIAFVRRPGEGGAPQPILKQTPQPWSIWIANATAGTGHAIWDSPRTLPGSFPQTAGQANLHWGADSRLVFLADLDGWPHLYSIGVDGGQPLLLTPGRFMVEDVVESRDRRSMIYSANAGSTAGDFDRRHLFRVPVDRAGPRALTGGETLEWQPVVAGDDRIAFIGADARKPPAIATIGAAGDGRRELQAELLPKDFPGDQFVVPKAVTFTAKDGLLVHGQLFQRSDHADATPGIVFVHGGPPRQMLLGWHYMDYYSNSYAVNQYLANHGFTVLSVNYRLGIGYGHAFHHPPHWGPTGASEYQDVVAGAHFLQHTNGVDAGRIGIWGGSYGGYLTALGLARDSDLFKAGVDLHGVHDWSRLLDAWFSSSTSRYEKGDHDEAMKVSFQSSPVADVGSWTSPVLLIQGDDDRNVRFLQTVDLARRLDARHVAFEELVLPNEIHGFLRHASWLRADQATADFFRRKLIEGGKRPVAVDAATPKP